MRKLFEAEFSIGEQYRPVANIIVLVFSLVYAVSFLGLMQYVAYLGPGLGDALDFSPYLQVLAQIAQAADGGGSRIPLLLFVALTAANIIFTAGIIFVGYWIYPRAVGRPFPLTVLFTFLLLNAVCTMGIVAMHGLTGVAGLLVGADFRAGFLAFGHLLAELRQYAGRVPTLVEMPAWLAFLVLTQVGGFFHYWFHRLAHESRLLWLLFHRTHHMTPELVQPSTQAVFNAFPFFLFAAVPYVLIFSALGKLITTDSLLAYLICYKLLSAFSNLFSHQTALYEWAQQRRLIRLLSTVTSEGVYHYLHHSAEPAENGRRGNLVNIGGGMFFVWDRVFGTYRAATHHRPRVGLRGVAPDELSTNPLRLAIAGMAQLWFELRHCRSLNEALKIVFGASDYTPVVSRNYALRAGGDQR